jgi:CheY-like chemotaxis protein
MWTLLRLQAVGAVSMSKALRRLKRIGAASWTSYPEVLKTPLAAQSGDDPALCTVLNFALKDAGYDVRAYASANKAWDAAGDPLELDLLVTDLSFPNGQTNGLALSRNHRSAAVLFITADANAAEFVRDAGYPVLLKPFTILTSFNGFRMC